MTVLACGHDDPEGSGVCAVCGVTPTSAPTVTASQAGGGLSMFGVLALLASLPWIAHTIFVRSMTFEAEPGRHAYNMGLVAEKTLHLIGGVGLLIVAVVMMCAGSIIARLPRS